MNQTKKLDSLVVQNSEDILKKLDDLRNRDNALNWIMLSYGNQTVSLTGYGQGGLEEIKSQLKEDQIRFVVLEVVVKGDEYNPVKFVLLTWVGSKVPPGVEKASVAAHRKQLMDFLMTGIAIAGEFQPYTISDITYKELAGKLTRVSRQDTKSVDPNRHNMSRSHATSGDRTKSQVKIANEEEFSENLKKVHKMECQWALFTYLEGKKDDIGYYKSGSGLNPLKAEFQMDKIVYAVYSQTVKETTNVTQKILLITMVGPQTNALAKARSGAHHRAELAEFIKQVIPFHSHYQAGSVDELSEEKFLEKLRA